MFGHSLTITINITYVSHYDILTIYSLSDATSMDHIISAQPGLVPRIDSKHTRERISTGCVFFNHVSGLSYTHMQTSCNNEQTIEAKHAYERFATNHGVKLKRFHTDNGIFAENAFRAVIDEAPGQSITYCGVGAHHQNGLVERHIGNLTFGSRAGLLHAHRQWPQAIGTILWPFAWKDHERKYNHFNLDKDGRSPMNKFTGIDTRPEVRDFHPFECPVFVLDSRIQGRGAIPKGNLSWTLALSCWFSRISFEPEDTHSFTTIQSCF